jgi:hypothetical protein
MFRYVKVTSDGVTIVDNKTELTGLVINDGPICSGMCYLYIPEHIGPSLITRAVSSVLLSTIVTPSDVTFTYLNI